MPSKSPAQAKLMQAVAKSPSFAQKTGVSRVVAREFYEADKAARATELTRKLRNKDYKNG